MYFEVETSTRKEGQKNSKMNATSKVTTFFMVNSVPQCTMNIFFTSIEIFLNPVFIASLINSQLRRKLCHFIMLLLHTIIQQNGERKGDGLPKRRYCFTMLYVTRNISNRMYGDACFHIESSFLFPTYIYNISIQRQYLLHKRIRYT